MGDVPAQRLIDKIKRHLATDSLEDAVDAVYDTVDELLLEREFNKVATILDAAMSETLPLTVMLSFLTITIPAIDYVGGSRARLVEVVRAQAIREGGEPKADACLRGLC